MAESKFSSSSEDILEISGILLEVGTFTLRLWVKIHHLRASNSDRVEYVWILWANAVYTSLV